ncbi:MAG: ABC transporter ATP-binding protein [Elusimicrobia bacterium]|nr:ABC transporter ATP-binding protein [Elusimicrobiota bacterium]
MRPLKISHVSKSFPSSHGPRAVLRDVSFEIPAGGLLCLLGPNGSGKTTLLKTIATLLIPEEGTVWAGDVNVHDHPDRAKRLVGFASTEDQSFYGRLSARMNLWFYGQMYGLSERAFEARLADLSFLLDLSSGLDRPFRELSSGQKQRFLLARADLHDPAILILDEPHQNLDPRFSSTLRHVIREEWVGKRKKTVLVSTHHLEDAQKISDQWVVLADGEVRFSGSLSQARSKETPMDLEKFFNTLTESPCAG